MIKQVDKKQIKQDKLMNAYYDYIGELHLDNICDEIEARKKEIEKTEIPETMDVWFAEYIRTAKKKELRKNRIRKLKKVSSRAAIILLFLFVPLTFVTIGVEAVRVRMYNLLFAEHGKYLSVRMEEEQEKSDITILWEDYYFPDYTPDGFILKRITEFKQTKIVDFININNEHIIFAQAPNGTSFQLDTEGGTKEEVIISNIKGILVEKEGRNILFWNNEECSFYIASDLEPEIIKHIVESIEKK